MLVFNKRGKIPTAHTGQEPDLGKRRNGDAWQTLGRFVGLNCFNQSSGGGGSVICSLMIESSSLENSSFIYAYVLYIIYISA